MKQVTGLSVIDEQCEGKKICLIAFLPHILDSKASGREDYFNKIQDAAKSAKRSLFSFSWSEGGAQKELEAALKVSPANYPAIVAVNRGKGKFSKHRGAFSSASIKEFITSLTSGSAKVASLPDAFPAIHDVSLWDGKDAKVKVEEEFSLDDIMNEEL